MHPEKPSVSSQPLQPIPAQASPQTKVQTDDQVRFVCSLLHRTIVSEDLHAYHAGAAGKNV